MSKFLIACLGNIGDEYENTRHNIGFSIADTWALAEGVKFSLERLAAVATVKYKGKTFVLIKPSTYMNLSGKAVNYWMQAEKISIHSLLVVTDDIALPFGELRMKPKGSDGGHNGLKDIITTLNTQEFARLRFGVGNEFRKGSQSDYVLGKWSTEENEKLPERIQTAIEMVKSYGTIGIGRTMTAFNKK
ncbi:MAG: aminoacyl-tRNA hydrolase [Bacteroidia bacterium]|nr:aminoacyl-tRNA hydrolase [Bacteroidia bacterium]